MLSVAESNVSYRPREWPRLIDSSLERGQEVAFLGQRLLCWVHPANEVGLEGRWDQGLTSPLDPHRPEGGHDRAGLTFTPCALCLSLQ